MRTNVSELTPLKHSDLESLLVRTVELTLRRLGVQMQDQEVISSRQCAALLGVTPEHLSAMRARSKGPPWSGNRKWIRYRKSEVLEWLARLPKT